MIKEKLEVSHEPVLLEEVIEILRVDKIAHLHSDAQFIDATLGYGGHSVEFVSRGIFTLGIEEDELAIKAAQDKLSKACPTPQETERCFHIVHGNFRDLVKHVEQTHLNNIYGILFDLGVSSPQILSPDRGFSFHYPDAPLDMRMNPSSQAVTAADLLNSLPETHLFDMLCNYLQYKQAKKLASEIVNYRETYKIKLVGDFLNILEKVKIDNSKLNEATLPFMALRIAVNTEIQDLEVALPKAFEVLKPKGRLAVISFHSEEDRVVKQFFKQIVNKELGFNPVSNIIRPSEREINHNPRARSAKLRVVEKNEE